MKSTASPGNPYSFIRAIFVDGFFMPPLSVNAALAPPPKISFPNLAPIIHSLSVSEIRCYQNVAIYKLASIFAD
jgi:hypothetical protein